MARTTRHEVRGRPCVGICDAGSTMEFVPDHRKIETRTTSRAVNAARGEITPQHLCFSCQRRVLPDGRLPSTNRFWVPGRHRASGKTAWQDRSKTRPGVGGPVWPGGVRLSIIPPFSGKFAGSTVKLLVPLPLGRTVTPR